MISASFISFFSILVLMTEFASACSCVESESGNGNKKIQSMGTGFYLHKDGKSIFKFVNCVNRPGCRDLELSRSSGFSGINISKLSTIYTRFESFEEAIEFDKKENIARDEKRKSYTPTGHCSCPLPTVQSILTYANNYDYQELVNNFGIETASDYNECGECTQSTHNNYESMSFDTIFKTNINGKFFLKDNQLYFEAKAQLDSKIYKVNQNFKCAPLLKELLGHDLRLYSQINSLKMNDDSIEMINTCEIAISKQQFMLPRSNFPEELLKDKIFPISPSCKKPNYTTEYLSKARTILFIDHATSFDIQEKKYVIYVADVINKTKVEKIFIKDKDFIKKIEATNKDWNLSYAILSSDVLKLDENNAPKLSEYYCNSVVLLGGFSPYNELRKKYLVSLNAAEAEKRYQQMKIMYPGMPEEMLLRQSGKK